MGLIDPQELIQAAPPGSAVYARLDAGQGMETAFLIREESRRISRLGPSPYMEFRAALLVEGEVALIPILVQLNREREAIYETWLNVYQTGGGMVFLQDLASQPRLLIVLYGDRGRERAITGPNVLRESFAEMMVHVSTLRPWSMADFDRARERIYRRYPSPKALWRGLKYDYS